MIFERALGWSLSLYPSCYPSQPVAACLSIVAGRSALAWAPSHARRIYGGSVRAAAERARKPARKPTGSPSRRGTNGCWGFGASAAVADAGRRDQRRVSLSRSEMPWLQHHQTVALDIVRRPKATPIYEFERYMRCRDCSEVRRYPYKRSHLVALRADQDFGERSTVDMVAGRTVKYLGPNAAD